jgi:hypothetical protein
MATPRQLAANRRNARRSTGPRDTSRSRMNAQVHGILSSEALIREGVQKEDATLFRAFADGLRADLAPEGALEELLVDQVIGLTWRERRVLRYENAAIRASTDDEDEYAASQLESYRELTDDLAKRAEDAEAALPALSLPDPLERCEEVWRPIFRAVEQEFALEVDEVLRLEDSWEVYTEFSRPEVERLVNAACKQAKISVDEFWERAREHTERDLQECQERVERRRQAFDVKLALVSLPPDRLLERVQRYEGHLSRELYRALHELERLQAARLHGIVALPNAIDVDVSSAGRVIRFSCRQDSQEP